jgi:cytidine deaminase
MMKIRRIDCLKLIGEARKASRNSYSPYSRYRVGAALLTSTGIIVHGTNVENASYGLTICAERNALAAAVGAGHRTFKMIAVVARGKPFPVPCGACLQVLSEFCSPNMIILVARMQDRLAFRSYRLDHLLRHHFRL